MNYQFDHVIHYVKNPDKAKEFAKSLGIHAIEGGKHENRGTFNNIVHFDLSYIEWIGIFDEYLIKENMVPYSVISSIDQLNYREGIVRVALRTKSIASDANRFRSAGFEVIGPIQAKRIAPDGEIVQWQQLYINDPESEIQLPFLIQWNKPDNERRSDLKEKGTISNHLAGNLALKEIRLGVSNLNIATKWSEIFNLRHESGGFPNSVRLVLPGGDLSFVSDTYLGSGQKEVIISGAKTESITSFFGTKYRFVRK